MNTNTITQTPDSGARLLAHAYTELLLEAAKSDPSFGTIVLVRHPGNESPQPLHRGTVTVLDVLSWTADHESVPALRVSLSELYGIPWLTEIQVKALLGLAARTEDVTLAEAQARSISLDRDGHAVLEAYGCSVRLEGDGWIIGNASGQQLARCPSLASALAHVRLQHRFTFGRS